MAQCCYEKPDTGGILYCIEETHDATVPHRFVDGTTKPTLIPDDKATKPSSIVDEMARAIGGPGDCISMELRCTEQHVCEHCTERARAAASVVARRLREGGHFAQTNDSCRVCKLIAELEGGT